MVGGIASLGLSRGIDAMRLYGYGMSLRAQRPAEPETPVQPVRAVPPTASALASPVSYGLPLREGADPAEMAVRMRIRYDDPAQSAQAAPLAAAQQRPALPGTTAAPLPGAEDAAGLGELAGKAIDGAVTGAESAQKAAEEGKCETCEKRKYQDGSDDMSVSFQVPTRIDPRTVASQVRGHEMEHVAHEQNKAQREDRKIVSQSVTLHTAICPDCGRVYISGGTTRTTTKANPEQPQAAEDKAVGGAAFDAVA